MPRRWQLRIRDILVAIKAARSDLEGTSQAKFGEDAQLQRSVAYCLVVIGESASALDEETIGRAPGVPWNLMRGMRNRLVHEYFVLDPEIVWDTVTNDLPALIDPLEKMLQDAENQ